MFDSHSFRLTTICTNLVDLQRSSEVAPAIALSMKIPSLNMPFGSDAFCVSRRVWSCAHDKSELIARSKYRANGHASLSIRLHFIVIPPKEMGLFLQERCLASRDNRNKEYCIYSQTQLAQAVAQCHNRSDCLESETGLFSSVL